jgi:hypothetical protein
MEHGPQLEMGWTKKAGTYVFGPAFAIDNIPGAEWLFLKFSSGNWFPYIDLPPVPYTNQTSVHNPDSCRHLAPCPRLVRRGLPHQERASNCTHVASCKITALHHEPWNDSMKRAALVSEAMLACAKLTKVLGCFRDYVIVEMELDSTSFGWKKKIPSAKCFAKRGNQNVKSNWFCRPIGLHQLFLSPGAAP